MILRVLTAVLALASVAGGAVWGQSGEAAGEAEIRPDIVLITVDTLRADHLSPYGSELKTPAAARLARDGVVFEEALSPAPLTLPSHLTLMLSQEPFVHGVRNNRGWALTSEAPSLAQVLAAEGYATAAFVSAFVLNPETGIERGFQHFDNDFSTNLQAGPEPLERRAAFAVGAAMGWLRKAPRPFFLWLHLFDPHEDHDLEASLTGRSGRPYRDEVEYADRHIGRLLDLLDEKGLYRDSLIVYTSDHGESRGDHGEVTHGLFIYQSTQHIPLIIKPPGQPEASAGQETARAGSVLRGSGWTGERADSTGLRDSGIRLVQGKGPAGFALLSTTTGRESMSHSSIAPEQEASASGGGRVSGLARLLDVGPTILRQAGLRPPRQWQGIDLFSRRKVEEAYAESLYPHQNFGWSALASLRWKDFKYIRAARPELYDLEQDPDERNNLIEQRSSLANSLSQKLDDYVGRFQLEPEPQQKIDPQVEERLRALGYGSLAKPRPAQGLFQAPDPKDRLQLYLAVSSKDSSLGLPSEEAVEKLRGFLRQEPQSARLWKLLGRNLYRLKRFGEAQAAFSRGLELDPRSPELRLYLALSQFQAGDRDEAEANLRRIIEERSGDYRALVTLGILLQGEGQLKESIGLLRRAVQLNPAALDARAVLIKSLKLDGQDEEAARLESSLPRPPQ
ncbi:MAG TPA: sulfatase-like hydrolase/transferase [Acidobacteriota bacterium]|nr:sulfatase-like hydrolase/transferase [Acidobacteriota bacterium]